MSFSLFSVAIHTKVLVLGIAISLTCDIKVSDCHVQSSVFCTGLFAESGSG
jgi:hypothetical protein